MLTSQSPLELFCDCRTGNEQWVFSSEYDMAQIPENIRKCVAFIGYRKKLAGGETEIVPCGTGLLTSRRTTASSTALATYLVTARHVLEEIAPRAIDDKVHIRVNLLDGTAKWIELNRAEWVFAESQNVDVAIMPFAEAGLAHAYIQEELFATDATFSKHKIGPGDEVFFPGLLTHHVGQQANVPIVRTGSIAALPKDHVKTTWGTRSIKAHLIEARSIGGLSGSPVFVQVGPIHKKSNGQGQLGNILYFLIGMVHGHFDSPDMAEDAGLVDASAKGANSGIAIVIPSTDIAAALSQPNFVAQRAGIAAKKKGGAIPD